MSHHKPPFKSNIRDNHSRGTVGNFLDNEIKKGSKLSIVSAYFTIYAFNALKDRLNGISELRFLLGQPDFITGMSPGESQEKAFHILDSGLHLNQQLQQKSVANACAQWIKEKVEIKSARQSNLLHGKMYYIETNGAQKAIMGSSNFTVHGLGLSPRANNIELNFVVDNDTDRQEIKKWFDDIWNEKKLSQMLRKMYSPNSTGSEKITPLSSSILRHSMNCSGMKSNQEEMANSN